MRHLDVSYYMLFYESVLTRFMHHYYFMSTSKADRPVFRWDNVQQAT